MARPLKSVPTLAWRGGVAYYNWYDPDIRATRRESLKTRDVEVAKRRYAEKLSRSLNVPQVEALTVSAALDDYYKEHVLERCTDPVRQMNAIVPLKRFFRRTRIGDVDIPMSRSYADARRSGKVGVKSRRTQKRGVKDSTIRRELNVLGAAANHARKWKRIANMPSIERPRERRTTVDDEVLYLTKDEVARLILNAGNLALRCFIVLAYFTAARRASIEQLTWSQVRWDQRQILLQKPGKFATKKRQPIVWMTAEMEAVLKEQLAARQNDNAALDARLSGGPRRSRVRPHAKWSRRNASHPDIRDRVFLSADYYWEFRILCERLGLEDRSRPHVLRHSRASHLLQDGVSVFAVAGLLGDTVSTVERVYGHHNYRHIGAELARSSLPLPSVAEEERRVEAPAAPLAPDRVEQPRPEKIVVQRSTRTTSQAKRLQRRRMAKAEAQRRSFR